MNARPVAIVTEVTFERVLPAVARDGIVLVMEGELRYDAADPLAVTMTVFTAEGPVRWTMARELLLGGCQAHTGEGDVRVRPDVDDLGCSVLLLELYSPEGTARLTTPAADVAAFCERVLAAVPLGTESEHLDVDGLIHRLLMDAWPGP
jgi:hypothetical protein